MSLKLSIFIAFLSQNLYTTSSDDYVQLFLNNEDGNNLIKIDFLIIQNLTIEEVDLNEKWIDLDEFIFSEELIYLKDEPTTFVTLSNNETNDLTLLDIRIESSIDSPVIDEKKNKTKAPQPFLFERVPFQKKMKDIEANLNRSRDYRVVYYNSWYQPVFQQEKSIPVFIEAVKKDKKVYGEINIYKERFIHLDSRIRFSQQTNEIVSSKTIPNLINFQELVEYKERKNNEAKVAGNYWMETIFNTVKVNFKYLENFIMSDESVISPVKIEEPIYMYQDLYEINKDTKLEVETFNFVDHPYFSILIRVEEISS
tara:strand:+ start:619 stop:1554 length:936 start_codon:yes stop_codon:yes gene_type:complete